MADLARTPEVLERIEEAVAENHGSIRRAALALATKASYIRMWMASDPEAHQRIRAAMLIGHASLEDVAIERAVYGVEEDVWYQGDVVGQKTNYSDGLLKDLLKARVSEYASEPTGHTGLQVNVNIMPRASNYEEWIQHREQALANNTTVIDHAPQPPAYTPSPEARGAYALMAPPIDHEPQPYWKNATENKLRDVL
jgi:hypothetical protein